MPATKPFLGWALFGALFLSLAQSACAQQFAGQTVTVMVSSSAGGPTDVEGRIIAQYLPKYLSGATGAVVRNVAGVNGIIAANQLATASGRDKLMVGFFTWNPISQIIRDDTLHVRYNDFKFIAGMRQPTLLYIRKDTAPGIAKPADIAKAKPFRAGALGPAAHGTFRQRLALDLLGVKYDTIPGYKGLRDVETAVLQGDIQLSNNSLSGYITSVKPNLVDTGVVIPLLQYDRADGPGRNPDLPDVPTFTEVYKAVYGKDAMPHGQKWQALQFLTRLMDSMYRTVFMAPNAPPAAVEEVRVAFEKLEKDPEFLSRFEKVTLTKPHFVIGSEGERIIAELGKMDPAMVTFFRQYLEASR